MGSNISDIIRQKLPTFSKGQKRIAQAILDDYEKTAYMTAARLGQAVGVSESTVVRFANELGFDGYPEFQRAVQELVRTKLTPNQRIEVTRARVMNGDYLTCVLNGDMERSAALSNILTVKRLPMRYRRLTPRDVFISLACALLPHSRPSSILTSP